MLQARSDAVSAKYENRMAGKSRVGDLRRRFSERQLSLGEDGYQFLISSRNSRTRA